MFSIDIKILIFGIALNTLEFRISPMKVSPLYFFIVLILISCNSNKPNEKDDLALVKELSLTEGELTGKTLADAYCGACHVKPEPDLLDKLTWQTSVLPDMRRRMGLILEEDFGHAVGEDIDAPAGIYAAEPLISREDWALMESYYLENAPDKLAENALDFGLLPENSSWRLKEPRTNKKRPNLSTFVRWEDRGKVLFVGDRYRQVFKFDVKNNLILDSIQVASPASDILFQGENSFDLLTMGVMDPSNTSIGRLESFRDFDENAANLLLDSLTRPVHFSYADLTGNGENELIVCHFGHHVGKLTWYEKSGNGYTMNYLNNRPGARRTIIEDVNGDGKPDVIALMTQAKEGVYVYLNQGKGKFKEYEWLSFSPLFGSSDFVYEDIDGDGHKDIVLVSGDNADLSPILKPYHGLRIFLNDGKNNFAESYFQPFHGASALIVEDFTGNGHKDIAVISYFPKRDEGQKANFLFFENHGELAFSLSKKQALGEWSLMTMDTGDITGNGKNDLILGGFDFASMRAFPPGDWVPFLILENHY